MRSSPSRSAAAAATAALLLAGLSACGGLGTGQSDADAAPVIVHTTPAARGPYAGHRLQHPLAMPHLVLRDQHGRRYDLRQQTGERLTLLYVGYTHCPDICPTTMADLASVRAKLTSAQRDRLRIVFVTSDPGRDTPQRLASWLGSYDPAIVGLTGDFHTIRDAVEPLGIGVEPPHKGPHGAMMVTHSAQVLLFGSDRVARVVYAQGFRTADVLHDLRYLLR